MGNPAEEILTTKQEYLAQNPAKNLIEFENTAQGLKEDDNDKYLNLRYMNVSMKKPEVFITRAIPREGLERIRENFRVGSWEDYAPPPKQTIIERARSADALVTFLSDCVDTEVFDALSNLRMVSQMAVGFDNINVKKASERGICVTNTPNVLTETTADFAMTLLMAVARRLVEADKYVRDGKWNVAWHPNMMLGRDVHGATLGIVGAGRIGFALAERAKGFKMRILYYDSVTRSEMENKLGAKRESLSDLLKASDFVSIHVPLTKDTFHLIDSRKLKLMKKTAYLINNSRGAVVDEEALCNALHNGEIAGAGLDVFEKEPIPENSQLLALDNVVLAPHISSASCATRSRMSVMVAENLIAFFKGEIPPNLVNPQALEVKPLVKCI